MIFFKTAIQFSENNLFSPVRGSIGVQSGLVRSESGLVRVTTSHTGEAA